MQGDAFSKIDIGTTATWRAAGVTRARLARLVQTGELVRIRHSVYATARILAAAETNPQLGHALQVAAVLATRTRKGVASHHSAARMHGLDLLRRPPDAAVTFTVPPGTRKGPYARTDVVRHPADLPEEHVTKLYGLLVTTAARTAADIARTATFMEGVVVADSALYKRYASKTEMRRVLTYCEQWPGIKQARQVVEFASPLAESALESCARVIFRELSLPPPALQVNIIGRSGHFIARTDFCWDEHRTIAEADGLLKYASGADAIAQLKRDRLLRAAGYEVVHFTWQELFSDPADIATRIRAGFSRALRLAGAPLSHYPDAPPQDRTRTADRNADKTDNKPAVRVLC
ncbi:type IV toxin-antitoxin system AbiEi family antitoxin domain-containing protein [Trebonia sp.]|uniref:type IV toxin-antitoxin system AbiEi family antitoxin domain-containing protein n=1 Tax=Trebonia sp. TaxID=2767075 RepID=UPI002610709C|nr:type IV toxin-antitoxin system AbiEi family antitoxin domain-containing protein [Trebonia sp.]